DHRTQDNIQTTSTPARTQHLAKGVLIGSREGTGTLVLGRQGSRTGPGARVTQSLSYMQDDSSRAAPGSLQPPQTSGSKPARQREPGAEGPPQSPSQGTSL
ncbi:E3 ubiquitin-protein ligase DTX4, partial [Manis javanica]